MSQKHPSQALTKEKRDAMFRWFLDNGVRLINSDSTPQVVASEISKALGFACTVNLLDLFRRHIALAFAAATPPTNGEILNPFWGLCGVLTLAIWVFMEGHPLDSCFVNLAQVVKDEDPPCGPQGPQGTASLPPAPRLFSPPDAR